MSSYTLTNSSGKKYILTVEVDSSWMNDEGRSFPVTVDPAVTTANSNVVDTYIDSADHMFSGTTSSTLYVNASRSSYWRTTTLPTIPLGANIIESTVTITTTQNVTYGSYIGVYEVFTIWDPGHNLYYKYNYGDGSFRPYVSDYLVVSDPGEYSFDITKTVKGWYEGYLSNYGIVFSTVLTQAANVEFYSNDASSASLRPVLTVKYKDMKGIEAYWPYSSHSVGAAGAGNVNLANGNLVFTIPTLTTTDKIFSYNPSLVYNSSISANSFLGYSAGIGNATEYLGYGFKLSVNEIISLHTNSNGETYYVYVDADGTDHYFFSVGDGVYADDEGLGMILSTASSGDMLITDNTKTIKYFSKITHADFGSKWRLTYIQDVHGNRLKFYYHYVYNNLFKPTKITLLPVGNTIEIDLLEFRYHSTTGKLTMVYNPTSKMAVVFRYSDSYNAAITASGNKYLRRVDYAYGNSSVTDNNWSSFISNSASITNITLYKSAEYNYDSNGRLIEVKDVNESKSIKYTWSNNRISKISEYVGTSIGQELGFKYDVCFAEVRVTGNDETLNTSDDILTRYTLDLYGRAVSTYSCSADGREIYGAASGVYDTQSESKNSLTQQTVIGDISPNLLLNGDFQGSNNPTAIPYWTVSANVVRKAGNNIEKPDELFLSMSPSSSSPATASQTVTLSSSGTYTFSMEYETENCENILGKVEILNSSSTELIHTEDIRINSDATNHRDFFSTSFELLTSSSVEVRITFTASDTPSNTMNINIGKVKLEKGDNTSEFTITNAGGFDSVLDPMGKWSGVGGSMYITTDSELVGNCLYFSGNLGTKYATQTILLKTPQELSEYENALLVDNYDYQFTLSGYAKADNPILGKNFNISVRVKYYRGSSVEALTVTYPVNFSTVPGEWQFATGTFSLNKDAQGEDLPRYVCVQSVEVICDYSNQAGGSVYFDNISLTFSGLDRIHKNEYDGGLPIKVTNGYDITFYVYDTNRNVSKIADNKGNLTEYTYSADNQNRVETVKKYTYTYNGATSFYPYHGNDSTVLKYPILQTEYTYNSYGMITSVITYGLDSFGTQIYGGVYNKQAYTYDVASTSKIFGALLTEKNGSAELHYLYDDNTGWLIAQGNVDSGKAYVYTYDGAGQLTKVEQALLSSGEYTVVSNPGKVTYSYDSQNRLTGIITNETTYSFTYDTFGNSESINIGNTQLAEYEYDENNDKLKRVIYGNGYEIEYSYNELEQLKLVRYKKNASSSYVDAYEYEYTSDGQVYLIRDIVNNKVVVNSYDGSGRFTGSVRYSSTDYSTVVSTEIDYDSFSRVDTVDTIFAYLTGESTVKDTISGKHTYLVDGKLGSYEVTGNLSSVATYTYDALDRVVAVSYNNIAGSSTLTLSEAYGYLNRGTGYGTTSLISSYTSTVGSNQTSYTYTYDADGNIINIQMSDGSVISYTYDGLGQLISENNDLTGLYYTYTYDKAGNLVQTSSQSQSSLSSQTIESGIIGEDESEVNVKPNLPPVDGSDIITKTYTYSNSQWGDLLTSYNGTALTYDAIGNPISYYNGISYAFTWKGRQLTGATKGSTNISFAYDEAGLRTRKTVNGTITRYVYEGTLLIAEYTNTKATVYIYDANGSPIGFKSRTSTYAEDVWDVYWYEKNLQGDIVAIYNTIGTKLIGYHYNAWGGTNTSYYNGGVTSTAVNNNLKYRGYYYDSDLGMYYLQSRYYDPVVCRFISADYPDVITASPKALTDKNLFAYCDNNPVMRVDHDGEFWNYIIGGVIGALCGGISAAYSSFNEIGYIDTVTVCFAIVIGGVGGVIGASGLPWYVQSITSAGLSIINDLAVSFSKAQELDIPSMIFNATFAALSSAIASSLTYSARNSSEGTIRKGVGRVTRGITIKNSGSNYWKGAIKRGIQLIQEGAKNLNIAQGQASVIGTSISFVITNIKEFFSSLGERK